MSDENVNLIEVKKAVEVVGTTFEQFKAANDERLKEIEAKGHADPLLEEKLAKMELAIQASEKVAEQAVLAVKRSERVVTDANGDVVDLDVKAANWAAQASLETKRSEDGFNAEGLASYKSAFNKLIRHNFDKDFLNEGERKALSVGQDSAGGYFVEPDMSGRIVQKIFDTSPVRAYAGVQVIGTTSLEGYYDNDQTGFGWVSELEARPETGTPAVGKWSIPVHEMYAMPSASQTVLDDSMVPLESWLDGKIADRFARAENNGFVVGSGVGQPRGFATYADGTDLTNSVARFKTGVNGDFAAAPAGGDVLIRAITDLQAQYAARATWFMNRTTAGKVRLLKNSDGSYIWQAGISAGQPATLLGYQTATFEDLPDVATGSLSMFVGDMREAYQVVDRAGIRMLRDPYSSKPKVLFYATKRTGGDLINGHALRAIEFSA